MTPSTTVLLPIPPDMIPRLLDLFGDEGFGMLNTIAYCQVSSMRALLQRSRHGYTRTRALLADFARRGMLATRRTGNRHEFFLTPAEEWNLTGAEAGDGEEIVSAQKRNVSVQKRSVENENVSGWKRNVSGWKRNVSGQKRSETSTYMVPEYVPGSPVTTPSNIIQLPGTQGPQRVDTTPRIRRREREALGRWWLRYTREGRGREEQLVRLVEMIEAVFLTTVTASEREDLAAMLGAPMPSGELRSAEWIAEHVWEMATHPDPKFPVWLTKERCEQHEARKAGRKQRDHKHAVGYGNYGLSPNAMRDL